LHGGLAGNAEACAAAQYIRSPNFKNYHPLQLIVVAKHIKTIGSFAVYGK